MSDGPELSFDRLLALPKIDLHRHLLGSVRPQTLWELACAHGMEEGQRPLRDLTDAIVKRRPVAELSEYITPWQVFRRVVQSPDDIRRIAFEAASDALFDGVRYVEFRASLPGMPIAQAVAQARIPASEYLDAIRRGFSGVPGIVCRLIASVPRHLIGPNKPDLIQEYAERFLETVSKFRDNFIVGVDLTGIEKGWPASLFKDFFSQARSSGLPITIHAGETGGPEEIWAAIDQLGASRIGHGTSAPQDENLVKELIKRNIVLEVCPTSSWLVSRAEKILSQPVVKHLVGIPYVICTDNPTVNDTTQGNELFLAAKILGTQTEPFSKSQFSLAKRAAFCPSALNGMNGWDS